MKYVVYWSKPFKFCGLLDEPETIQPSSQFSNDQVRAFSFWLGREALENEDDDRDQSHAGLR